MSKPLTVAPIGAARLYVLFLIFASLTLPGCGGGGSTGKGAPPVTKPPVTKCVPIHDGTCMPDAEVDAKAEELGREYAKHTSYRNQWGLDSINADRAYGNVELVKGQSAEPGAGVTIGFVDTGIDTQHEAFSGKTVTEVFVDGTPDETGMDEESHGTAVASVAAGARSASAGAAHGVAWGADIAMFAVLAPPQGDKYVPVSLAELAGDDDDRANIVNTALTWHGGTRKVDILNISAGYSGIIDGYSEQDLRTNFGHAIAAMAQAGVKEDKTIFVWSAGNAHGARCDPADLPQCVNGRVDAVSVEVMAGLAARIEELRGHTLAVVALQPDDPANDIAEGIARFSNRCGIAADYCIAAPGKDVRVAYFGPDRKAPPGSVIRGYDDFDGTSFSAPMVAGGLALMKQLFRDQITNEQLVARLLDTADNSGPYADRAIYGRGKMDLGAATSPVGVLSVPTPQKGTGTNALLGATWLQSGSALGDGLAMALASTELMALDDLGAPFWFSLGRLAPAAQATLVGERLRGFLAPAPGWQSPMASTRLAAGKSGLGGDAFPARLQVGFLETPQDAGGHLALAGGAFTTAFAGRKGLAAAAFTTRGTSSQTPSTGATLMWRPTDSVLGVQAGWLGESQALLGSVGKGAFGTLGGNTGFLRVEGRGELGRWRIGASAEYGVVHARARGGIVAGMSSITTSAFALHAATAPADWGTVRVSVSQPLRVEHGSARLSVPAARTKAGAVLHRPVRVRLEPTGRQFDVAGQWSRPLGAGELRLGGVWSYRPGQAKAADPEVTLLAGWRWAF